MIIMLEYTTVSVKKETKKRLISIMSKEDEYDPFLNKLIDCYEARCNEIDSEILKLQLDMLSSQPRIDEINKKFNSG